MAASGSHKVVYAALIGNAIIALMKLGAAALTGSSAMMSESVHSIADTGNEVLMLLGLRRSHAPPDQMHPFGHGKELYFWGVIVAMLLFGMGGGISVYEGIMHLLHPAPMEDAGWNYWVLGIAFVFESASFSVAATEFHRYMRRSRRGAWRALLMSKDPALFVVLLEDLAALAGIIFAVLGIYLSHTLQNPAYDGIASLLIGVLLAVVASFLAWECRGLLVGESLDPDKVVRIRELARATPQVQAVEKPLTMYLGPDQVLLNLTIRFSDGISGTDVIGAIDRLEREIRRVFPEIKQIFIEAESFRSQRPRPA